MPKVIVEDEPLMPSNEDDMGNLFCISLVTDYGKIGYPDTVKDEMCMFHLHRGKVRPSAFLYDVFTVWKKPTENCQLSSIGGMDKIIDAINCTDEQAKWDEITSIILEALSLIGTRLTVIDVCQKYCDGIDRHLNVLTKTPYTSTNGTLMCLYIIEWS